jgi:hypothetical protein
MLRELLEDILYVLLNLILAKKIVDSLNSIDLESLDYSSIQGQITTVIVDHYIEYAEGYKYLELIRMYALNNYTSESVLKYQAAAVIAAEEEE